MRRHAQRIAQENQPRRTGWPFWLIVFLAILAVALGLGLALLPHLSAAAIAGGLVLVSILIAVTALIGLRAGVAADDTSGTALRCVSESG